MLFDKILKLISSHHTNHELLKSQEKIQKNYKTCPNSLVFQSDTDVLAYVSTRMPATYAVLKKCLAELPNTFSPKTILDLGTGPGTAIWTCLDYFQNVEKLVGYDANPSLLKFTSGILEACNVSNVTLYHENFDRFTDSQMFDLIILSYALNEMSEEKAWKICEKAVQNCQGFLIITLPGTPKDFNRLLFLRQKFIEKNIPILAPCPHAKPCPLSNNDWCHFSVRLNRTQLHKNLKKGTLGYEDEKYCYLILGKNPADNYSRIIKRPLTHKGHMRISLCTPNGDETEQIFSQKLATYSTIKKKDWGDRL